ncbi:hypothetical protein [Pseudomonas sp. PSE14]|uniref:hypothetical protein n=1 Tax=Pseudomonas sp. PSE14 TaxID=3016341 RepID=UPI0023D82E4D|nr:hypothetical protein [Pseudomonas sp. PSE14]WEJ71417.1 hypothetical protein O6P39_22585 [Pseudomonas sp. PSE14]
MLGIPQEMLLPLACTFGGIFGSLTQAAVATITLDGPPNKLGIMQIAPPELQQIRGMWLFLRIFIGGVLGFVFGLYFIGTLNDEAGTFARIWALSFGVGYAAPKIWAAQEKALLKQVAPDEAPTSRSEG